MNQAEFAKLSFFKKVLKVYFSLNGRIGRMDFNVGYGVFFLSFIPIAIFLCVSVFSAIISAESLADKVSSQDFPEILKEFISSKIPFIIIFLFCGLLVQIYGFWVYLALTFKRLHDLNLSGFWAILAQALPIFVNILILPIMLKMFVELSSQHASQESIMQYMPFLFVINIVSTIVSLLVLVGFIYISIAKGKRGANKYGEDAFGFFPPEN